MSRAAGHLERARCSAFDGDGRAYFAASIADPLDRARDDRIRKRQAGGDGLNGLGFRGERIASGYVRLAFGRSALDAPVFGLLLDRWSEPLR
jgi:hypothetical protein